MQASIVSANNCRVVLADWRVYQSQAGESMGEAVIGQLVEHLVWQRLSVGSFLRDKNTYAGSF